LCVFIVSFDYFIPVFLAIFVLGLVSSLPSQEIGLGERLRNDLFCFEWDVNLNSVCQSSCMSQKPHGQI